MANSICISVTHYHSTITNYHVSCLPRQNISNAFFPEKSFPPNIAYRNANSTKIKPKIRPLSPTITNYHTNLSLIVTANSQRKKIRICLTENSQRKKIRFSLRLSSIVEVHCKLDPNRRVATRMPLKTRSKSSGREENAIVNSIKIVGPRRE